MEDYYKNLNLENISYIDEEGIVCLEEFRNIPFTLNLQASNLGRIKNLNFKNTGRQKIIKPIESTKRGNYLNVNLKYKGKYTQKGIHQLVAMAFLNHVPNKFDVVVDHKNNNTKDNKLNNLQLLSNRDNIRKHTRETSSKYAGVFFDKWASKYRAVIRINNVLHYLGSHDTEEEAYIEYEKALYDWENLKILPEKPITSSIYKGVSYNKLTSKWEAYVNINKKRKHIGLFDSEENARKGREEYLNSLSNN